MVDRSGSSRRWLGRQRRDTYVERSRREGYRSRAASKLIELDKGERLLRSGMSVVDLGAAPGGFSQYAARQVGPQGSVLALDFLDMEPIDGVTVLQGDFTDPKTVAALRAKVPHGIDLVISDMAPNISGNKAVDQPRCMSLAELALEFACEQLNPGGDLLVKLFQGEGFETYVEQARQRFVKVKVKKPRASRASSREMYLLARTYQIV